MKKKLIKLFFAGVFFTSLSASAQIYVNVRPIAPTVVVTARPSVEHVWIGDEWNESNGAYVYGGGYWATPPHPGYRYREGRWNHHETRGDHWEHGAWHDGKRK